ncbi:MAG: zinc ribbon domain-containing protein [Planctomyces sp.]|nr:zinc ribbon domain-containing protein [Planctomyces sp.]
MPMFEFACEKCEKEFEMLVDRNESPVCPHCGSTRLEKLMSVSSGRVAGSKALPIASSCPPPSHGPCGPGCCRIPG